MTRIPLNLPLVYDYVEFTLTNGQSDYDVKANQANLFNNVPMARSVIIKTNKNITFKFNDTILSAVDLDVGDSPYQSPNDFIAVDNIYLSNSSGTDATIKMWLV